MDWTEIINIVIKIIVGIIGVAITIFLPKVKLWLENKVSASTLEKTTELIKIFCNAAEQQFKLEDKSGEARKQYVEEQLLELGIEMTEQINAMIEAQVLEINSSNAKKKSK